MSGTNNDIEIVGGGEYPPTESVKLHGPPGTGKTTQTMERLKSLLSEHGYSVSDICFVTYRREMAERFLERLNQEELITYDARVKPWKHDTRFIGTLHAVCNRLSDLETPREGNRQIGGIMHEFCIEEFGVPYFKANDEEVLSTPGELMFSARSWCIENEIPFEQWHKSPQYAQVQEKWEYRPEMPEFNERWEAEKAEREIADFEDMLTAVRDGGLTPPRRVIAVDEYHDFTPLQDSICRRWMDEAEIVIVNGDPLQVVYSYKGADPSYYTSLDYPEILLPQSYRVPRSVWEYAGKTLRPEYEPPDIEPKTPEIDPDGYDGSVEEVLSDPLGSDGTYEGGRTPASFVDRYGEDTMFLVRTRSQERDVGDSLKDAGIIFGSQSGGGGWNQSDKRLAIYNVLAALDGVRHPAGRTGQQPLINAGRDNSLPWDEPEQQGTPPSEVWAHGDEWSTFFDRVPAELISGKTKENLLTVLKNEPRLAGDEIAEYTTPKFWTYFTNGPDSVQHLLSYDGKPLIAKALRRYDSEVKRGTFDTRVQTIHASKGGEAETVILYDGVPDRVSSSIRKDEREAKNEARLWYVGCTRASDCLIVARGGWDWVRDYLPKTEREKEELKEALASDGGRQ